MFTEFEYKDLDNTGTTVHSIPNYEGGYVQITAVAIVASGTLTITAMAENSGDYQLVTNGVIDLTAEQTVVLQGRFDAFKFTASVGGDTYKIFIVG